jgi:hypothetical protein
MDLTIDILGTTGNVCKTARKIDIKIKNFPVLSSSPTNLLLLMSYIGNAVL